MDEASFCCDRMEQTKNNTCGKAATLMHTQEATPGNNSVQRTLSSPVEPMRAGLLTLGFLTLVMENQPIPAADPRLTAILDRLHALDRAQEPNDSLAAKAQIEANASEDIRFLVTQLWKAYDLHRTAKWALVELRRLHGECLGCPVCDCEGSLETELACTEAITVWAQWPNFSSPQRKDNLLMF